MRQPQMIIAPVVPALALPENVVLPFYFSDSVSIRALPDWLTEDAGPDDDPLRSRLCRSLAEKGIRYCIAIEYEADSPGSPDRRRRWLPRATLNTAFEKAHDVLFALWLTSPSDLRFIYMVHAAKHDSSWFFQDIVRFEISRFFGYAENWHEEEDFHAAKGLFHALSALPPEGTVRIAANATMTARAEENWAIRFLIFWIVLESLFGAEDARETTYRLSLRMALFLQKDTAEGSKLFAQIRDSYAWRSRIVHGLRLAKLTDEKSQTLISELEGLVRRSLVAVLSDSAVTGTFDGKDRERYLDSLAFK